MAKHGTAAKMRRSAALWRLATVLAATSLLCGGVWVRLTTTDVVIDFDLAQLSSLSDSALEPRLHSMANSGGHGLALVVKSLSSPRSALAGAAIRTLHTQIDRALALPDSESQEELDRLARSLAKQVNSLRGPALGFAAEIAERILALSTNRERLSRRLGDCHLILARHAQQQLSLRAGKTGDAEMDPWQSTAPLSTTNEGPFPLVFYSPPLSGGDLPVAPASADLLPIPERIVADARPFSNVKRVEAPQTVFPVIQAALSDPSPGVHLAANDASPPNSAISLPANGSPSHAATAAEESQPAEAHAVNATDTPEELVRLLALDKQLHSDSAREAAAARKELEQNGVDEVQLKLAHAAVDGNSEIRRQVAEALAIADSVDARRWLLWLSHDKDADVRRTVISLLATTTDPALRKRVREAAEDDADAKIRDEARSATESWRR